MTPFEEQLKAYFPDIFELHLLGKSIETGGKGEVHIWDLIGEILEAHRVGMTGSIQINVNKGRIDQISVMKKVLDGKASRPGY